MNKNKSRISRDKEPKIDIADVTKLVAAGTLFIGALTELARVLLPLFTQ